MDEGKQMNWENYNNTNKQEAYRLTVVESNLKAKLDKLILVLLLGVVLSLGVAQAGEVTCIKISEELTICTDEDGNDTEIWTF